MKKKVISALLVLLFLFFIGVMDYPFIVQLINDRIQGRVVMDYESTVKNIGEEQVKSELKKAEDYNLSLLDGVNKQTFPDSFDVATEGGDYYNSLLKATEDGVMATIEIPKIQVQLPIYHTTNDYSLENGVGHLEGSSLPIGGDSTHSCLSAHRGLPSKRLFTDLDQLVIGDKFFIKVYNRTLAYQVYNTEVVKPEEVDQLLIQNDKDLVTLITCTPYGVNSHRIYVHGERVPYVEGEESDYSQGIMDYLKRYWWVLLTIFLLIWMIFLLRRFNKQPEITAPIDESSKGDRNDR